MTATKLPEPLRCPESWKYTEEWQAEYEKEHGHDYLSKVCKHTWANHEIMFYITYTGESALTRIKKQNLFIKRFTKGTANPAKVTDSETREIDWPGSSASWEGLQKKWEELFEIYNADKAPSDILKVLHEVKAFIDAGQSHCQELLQYIVEKKADLAKQEEADREQQYLQQMQQRQAQADKWKVIDVENSKVTEGFVYLLSNSLMPGVYKIGFTAGNSDKRAREISVQYGLPMPFEVTQYWRTKDPYIIEQRVHFALTEYEKAGEFFEVDLQLAIETIEAHLLCP